MQIKLYFLSLFLSFSALAADERTCHAQAESFGNGEGRSSIDSGCIYLAREHAQSNQYFKSVDGNLKILGYENVIYFEINLGVATTEHIAGSSTMLKEITSLTYNLEKKEITVVDSVAEKKLVFDLGKWGNVAPKRIIPISSGLGQ